MKLLSIPAEVKAIRTICSDFEKCAGIVLSTTSEHSFHYPPAKEAYKLIRKTMFDSGEVPSWTEVISSPALSEQVRKVLRNVKDTPMTDDKKVPGLVRTLDKYRKLRSLLEVTETLSNGLDDDKVDVDELMDQASAGLAKARINSSAKAKIYHFGKGNNTSGLIKSVLNGTRKPFIPTGYKGFDRKNGGILRGSLFMIGAPTGFGKTALATNLLKNMTDVGEDCCIVPLEMTEQQQTARIQGILTGQSVNRISQQKLTDDEKRTANKAYRDWITNLKQNNTRYSVWPPEEDVDIADVLLTLKPYKFDVILIDYISLLKGVTGDDQWKKLLEVTRYAKMFAKNNDCVVVLLFQTTKEGAISFSKNMANDCNNMWVLSGPSEEMEIIPMTVTQLKARNQSRHSFGLLNNTTSMLITDDDEAGESDTEEDEDDSQSGYLKDVNEDSTDDEGEDDE